MRANVSIWTMDHNPADDTYQQSKPEASPQQATTIVECAGEHCIKMIRVQTVEARLPVWCSECWEEVARRSMRPCDPSREDL